MNEDAYSLVFISDLIDRIYAAGHGIAVSRDVDGLLRAFLDAIGSVSSTTDSLAMIDRVSIATPSGPSALVIAAAWDCEAERTPGRGTPFSLISGAALGLAAHGETLVINDLYSDPRLDPGERISLSLSGLNTFIFAPLIVENRWLGLLTLASRRATSFTSDILRFSQIVADQMAMGMARLDTLRSGKPSEPTANTGTATLPGSDILRTLVDNAGESIVMVDLNCRITRFNRAAETLFGYQARDMIGRSATLLAPPGQRARYEARLRFVLQEGRPIREETERVTRDGRTIPVIVMFWPLKDGEPGSQPIINTGSAVLEITIDANEWNHAQIALQKERDVFEAILEATNDAIIVIGTARQILATNLQFEKFFQIPRIHGANQTVDQLVATIHGRANGPEELANLLLMFTGDEYQSAAGDFEIGLEEQRVLIWYSTPVYAQDGTLLGRLLVFRDATQEREADRTKSEFVSLVSHELKTPLTSIKGFTDFILDGDAGEIGEEVREYLDIVQLNAERLLSLINDILDITRIEAGRIQLRQDFYSVDAIIAPSRAIMQPMLDQRQQTLLLHIAPNLPKVWIDRDRMTQVLTNLISNASKYTSEGGHLTIDSHLEQSAADLDPSFPADATLPAIVISVCDTGMGIALKDQAQLFTRFYRTEQAAEQQIAGTGLGLAIVKSFVEMHGGRVWFKSEVGHGSTFYFTIPAVEA